jgi:hypothetical protein
MDRFTRNYSIVLAAIVVITLVWTFSESPGVSGLNAMLSNNADVAAYPYKFRVLDFDNGVATMSTPRSADFAANRALTILFPELRNEPPDSPAMLDAQQEMARVQGIARKLIEDSREVDRVVWELDRKWLRNEGIDPDHL